MTTTPTVKLASLVLGEDLGDWVARRRQDGESWADISLALAVRTNGNVRLSHEALRQKYASSAPKGKRPKRTA